jgi:DNA-binding HxlR family transcriptional regulator
LARRFSCAPEFAVAVLDGKWKSSILCCLQQHPCRYAQLRTSLPGLSDKMLSERLHDLVEAGLVVREALNGNSGQAYALSPLGRSLGELLTVLSAWALAHAETFGVQIGNSAAVPLARESWRNQSRIASPDSWAERRGVE